MTKEENEHIRREGKEKPHKHHHRRRKDHKEGAGPSLLLTTEGERSKVEKEEEEDWETNRKRLERICLTPPNNICNDCNSSGTRWASVNHGVFLCIRCSGIHRSLGVHISKVKSTNMDKWHATEVSLMEAIGNKNGKLLYEAQLPKGMKPLTGVETEAVLRDFIQRKYQDKSFAVADVDGILRSYYKRTRYGKSQRKGKKGKENASEREQLEGNSGERKERREEAMKALYGVNADTISRKSKKVKPLCGTFGIVSVPPAEYEERREALLTNFYIMGVSSAASV